MHIVIHAGPPKTASSTLQWVLWRNRDALSAAGIEYFHTPHPGEWSLVALYLNPDAPVPQVLSERLPTQDAMRAWSAEAWREFEARLDRTSADTMLVSSEFFVGVHDRPALIARLRRRADRLTIIGYVRDPVEMYVSGNDEWVRLGHDFAALRKPDAFHYTVNGFRAFAALLPKDALVLRSFRADDLAGGDVVADFIHLLSDLTEREVRAEIPRVRLNESLCAAASLWLMSTNTLGPFRGEARERRQALIKALRTDKALKDLPKLRMTDPEIAKAIRVKNRGVLDWLNAGPLAHAPLKTAPPDAVVLPAAELQERLRQWYLSYAREEDMRLVMDAVMRHGGQAPA